MVGATSSEGFLVEIVRYATWPPPLAAASNNASRPDREWTIIQALKKIGWVRTRSVHHNRFTAVFPGPRG